MGGEGGGPIEGGSGIERKNQGRGGNRGEPSRIHADVSQRRGVDLYPGGFCTEGGVGRRGMYKKRESEQYTGEIGKDYRGE